MPKNLLSLLMIAVCFLFWHRAAAFDSTDIVKNGIADLRNTDLQKNKVELDGEWAFSWKKLLGPGDTTRADAFIEFPQLWNKLIVNGQQLSAQGYGTYQLTVLLPPKHEPLALMVPEFYSAHRLFVNGKLLANNGVPDTSIENYSPHWVTQTVMLPAGSDTLHLLLQVANFSHAKGGTKKSIQIGDSSTLLADRDRSIAGDFLLAGCLFMGGLFFFGLYKFGKHDKAMLYFSLFSMLYSYRIVGSSYYALHAVFPDLPWELTTRLEYFTLSGSILLFIQYVRQLYPQDVYNPIIKTLAVFCLMVAITPVLTPTLFLQRSLTRFCRSCSSASVMQYMCSLKPTSINAPGLFIR